MTVDWLNKCVDAFKKLGHSDVRAAMLIGDIDAGLMEESGALVPVQESLPQIPPAEIESLVAMFKLLGKKDRHEILKFVGDKLLRANIGEDDPAENPTKNAKKPTKKAAT